MTAGIEGLEAHVIVCGFGRMGRILFEELSSAGADLIVVGHATISRG